MSVKKQAGKVWIEGVPPLAESESRSPWLVRTSHGDLHLCRRAGGGLVRHRTSMQL